MDHLRASATPPRRKSAAGKAVAQRPRTGQGSFEGCRGLWCFNDDEGLWLQLLQPCDSIEPSSRRISLMCAVQVMYGQQDRSTTGKKLLYDSVREGSWPDCQRSPFRLLLVPLLTSSSRIAYQLFLRNRLTATTKQPPASRRPSWPPVLGHALFCLQSPWDRLGPQLSATCRRCRSLP